MAEKRTGRPPRYTDDQVMEGIGIVERDGGTPTGESVKRELCTHLQVPDGINGLCLDREVQRLVAERERQRRERLVAALPDATRAAVKEIGAMVKSAVLVHLGHEHEILRAAAARNVAAKDADLGNQRAQIRDLVTKVDHKAAEIADLEQAKQNLGDRLERTNAENAALKARIAEIEKEEDIRSRMLALMKETLGQHPPAAAWRRRPEAIVTPHVDPAGNGRGSPCIRGLPT